MEWGLYRRRVTVFVGHFGSGKTEIALNAALELGASSAPLAFADLDVVKPYFRSRSARAILEAAGIELLAPSSLAIDDSVRRTTGGIPATAPLAIAPGCRRECWQIGRRGAFARRAEERPRGAVAGVAGPAHGLARPGRA